jgi:rRNA maturation endonuclease Nob1
MQNKPFEPVMTKAKNPHLQKVGDYLATTVGRVNQMATRFFFVNCTHCAEEISIMATTCNRCGHAVREPKKATAKSTQSPRETHEMIQGAH